MGKMHPDQSAVGSLECEAMGSSSSRNSPRPWHSRKGESWCRCAPWGAMKQILLQQVWFFPEAQGCKDLTLPGASASRPLEAVLGHWWARAKATVGSGMGGGGGGQGPPFRAPVLRCQASQEPQWLRAHLPSKGLKRHGFSSSLTRFLGVVKPHALSFSSLHLQHHDTGEAIDAEWMNKQD